MNVSSVRLAMQQVGAVKVEYIANQVCVKGEAFFFHNDDERLIYVSLDNGVSGYFDWTCLRLAENW